jgi:putative pyruvate formate lyase activating enzyme
LKGEVGYCGMDARLYISSFGPHYGEERELVGRFGSGTIFLTGCNLKCVFCQNYEISHLREGTEISMEEMAQIMLRLERIGCHNINFVTPTHYTPQIMQAILIARERGLTVPIVYNCGGYEKVETLRLLEGFIEIYMPDAKYAINEMAKRYSHVENYPEVMKQALKEMHRQVGDLVVENGIAKRGLLVRHLVMPNGIENARLVFKFIAEEISKDTYVNIMDQYYPCYKAFDYPEISRRLSSEEYRKAVELAKDLGLWRGF